MASSRIHGFGRQLFIDDVLDNVLGAKQVGMQGYHFLGTTNELEEILL